MSPASRKEDKRHAENQERLTRLESLLAAHEATLEAHTQEDSRRFAEVISLLKSIAEYTQSLKESRSFTKGVWKTVVVVATAVSSLVTIALTLWKGHS